MKNKIVLLSTLKQLSVKTLVLGISLSTFATQELFGQIPVTGTWMAPNRTTTTNAVGIGTTGPIGWEEIMYCDDRQNGLVVTNTACPYTTMAYPISFDGVAEPAFGAEPGGGGATIPYPTADFTLRPYGTYLGNSHPMMWARMQNDVSFLSRSSGAYTSRFMVCPNGVAGINIEAPRATFDIKSLGAYNYPGLIVGRQQLGSSTRTQHAMFVPLLANDGYSTLSQQNDQGLFFTDGRGTNGSNQNGVFIIAPWADPSTQANIGGLRIDNVGNLEVYGKTRTTELNVNLKWWSDSVFSDKYTLMALTDVEKFVIANKHLPNVPSECELREEGINVAEMQAVQIQKIEELTLYTIAQEKQITTQTAEINLLKERMATQEKQQTEQAAIIAKQQTALEELKLKLNLLLEAQLQNK